MWYEYCNCKAKQSVTAIFAAQLLRPLSVPPPTLMSAATPHIEQRATRPAQAHIKQRENPPLPRLDPKIKLRIDIHEK